MVPNSYQADAGQQSAGRPGKPAWLAPVVIVAVIVLLIVASRKREEVAENAVVDLLLLTVGVLAVAHVIQWGGSKLGAPGLSRFASLNYTHKEAV